MHSIIVFILHYPNPNPNPNPKPETLIPNPNPDPDPNPNSSQHSACMQLTVSRKGQPER